METVLTSKGQVVIPAEVRRRLAVKQGTHLHVEVDEGTGRIILTPVTRERVHSVQGRYKGRGLMKALLAEKRREKAL